MHAKRDDAPLFRRRLAADEGAPEESACEALPPIASAVPAEAGAGEGAVGRRGRL